MNIPNSLTLLRIVMIPVFVVAFYLPIKWNNQIACFIFVLAAVTDILDGYLARKLNQISSLGAFLDPVADKLMIAVVLVLLVEKNPTPFLALPAAVIIGREITISALREWMAEMGARSKVAVSGYGKLKTIMQMVALGLLIYHDDLFILPIYTLGYICLYIAVFLTLWSMFQYISAAWPKLKE